MSASISKVKGHNMPTSHETDKLERFHIKTSHDSIFKDGMFNRHQLQKNNGLFLPHYFENILICSQKQNVNNVGILIITFFMMKEPPICPIFFKIFYLLINKRCVYPFFPIRVVLMRFFYAKCQYIKVMREREKGDTVQSIK